jgi:hypothetical protein
MKRFLMLQARRASQACARARCPRHFLFLLLPALLAGCQNERFAAQPLPTNDYSQAFSLAKETFSQYFSIASANSASGEIQGQPKSTGQVRERLLGGAVTRQIASMRLRQVGQEVLAEVRVENQRQDMVSYGAVQPRTVYNEIPNQTPAQEGAALTDQQNQPWQTSGQDYALERTILNDLRNRLAGLGASTAVPTPTSTPTTRPGS